jgi:CubicO group peptidase (beta-lactamase class C family)
VSESWVELSTRPSQKLNEGYGLLWWLYERPKGYGAQGYLDTNLYVFPDKDLVAVRMQSKPFDGRTPSYMTEALALFEQFVK